MSGQSPLIKTYFWMFSLRVEGLQLFYELIFGKHLVPDHRIPGPVIACRATVVHLQLAESEFKVMDLDV